MSWMEFIARLSDAWAWPLVAGWSIFLLRKQIRSAADGLVERIGEIARLAFPGGSIDFRKEVEQLAQATDELTAEAPKALPSSTPEAELPSETTEERLTKYQQLALLDPRAAVLVAFSDLEGLVRQKFRQLYPQERSTTSFPRMIDIFHRDGALDEFAATALKNMFKIRSEAAHGHNSRIDVEVANSFVESVGSMIGYLMLSDFFGKQDG